MGKYIKWELKDYFNKKTIWFIIIGVVYFLFLITPLQSPSFFSGLITLAFSIIILVTVLGSFFLGTRRVINTFKEKTFLLESMIPLEVKRILLAKYLIGIIINFIFSFIGIIGLSLIILKNGGIDMLLEAYKDFFQNIDAWTFIRVIIIYLLSIITYMSIVILGDILTKVINPSGKGNKIIGTIIWVLLFYTYAWIIVNVIGYSDNLELFTDILSIVVSSCIFFLTSWLIENKLEIYN